MDVGQYSHLKPEPPPPFDTALVLIATIAFSQNVFLTWCWLLQDEEMKPKAKKRKKAAAPLDDDSDWESDDWDWKLEHLSVPTGVGTMPDNCQQQEEMDIPVIQRWWDQE